MRAPTALVVALAIAPAAAAAPPALSVSASATRGLAPFELTLTAATDAVGVRWELGAGAVAEGATVTHVYAAPGVYRATAIARSAGGEETRATVEVTAHRLVFGAPPRATYGERRRFTGSIWPPVAGATVTVVGPRSAVVRGRTRANGGFRLAGRVLSAGPFRAELLGFSSKPETTVLRPRIEARLVGTQLVGEPLRVVARVRPAAAGTLVVRAGARVARGAAVSLSLPTGRPGETTVALAVEPNAGYLPARRTLTATVARPNLGVGAHGPSVLALERRLRALRYALPSVDAAYGLETAQAVTAFQAVERLPRTGRVDARTWRRLVDARPPLPRHRGTHIEVSKGRQYLMVVRNGRVESVVHVSTGATGNTPIGTWRIYRKVTGWDWVLWYPMYFLRGFAIHGYPSVPSYPASHGCVRVPMWIAPRLFAQHGYGGVVRVYW